MLEGSGLEENFNHKNFEIRALRQLSTIAFSGAVVGIILLPIASCGNNGEDVNTTATLPQEVPVPAAEPFTKPTAAQQSPIAVPSPVLIQPTNGNQRAQQVQTGRQDPFAGLFIQTAPRDSQVASQPSSPSSASAPSPAAPSAPSPAAPPAAGNGGNGNNGAGSQPGNGTNGNGSVSTPPVAQDNGIPFPPPDESSFPPPLPSIPEPDLARRVAVSGVVQIGEQLQAIVQVPNEGTSRYVRVGQRLSNGEILVKRIEMSPGIEPVVILEQFGVEVAKAIGEQSASDSPDAASPTPTPPPPDTEIEEPSPVPSPEVTSPAPPTGTPTPVPVPPPGIPVPTPGTPPTTVPNNVPIPSPAPIAPGQGEF